MLKIWSGLKIFWTVLVKSYKPIKLVVLDNWFVVKSHYEWVKDRIFYEPWTISRFLIVWTGWCIGILPVFYFSYFLALCFFLFIRLFFVIIEQCVFKNYLFKYAEFERIKKVIFWYKAFIRIKNFVLDDVFDRFPNLVLNKINYYFSEDYFFFLFIRCLKSCDDYFYYKLVYLEWWFTYRFIEDLKALKADSIKFYHRSIRLIKFLSFKLRKRKNWVILFHDFKKMFIIFKWLFFRMSILDFKLKYRSYFISKKAYVIYHFWSNFIWIRYILLFLFFFFKIFMLYIYIFF